MNSFKKYLGAIVVILGAILLICSHFLGWNSYNGVQIGALVIMIAAKRNDPFAAVLKEKSVNSPLVTAL